MSKDSEGSKHFPPLSRASSETSLQLNRTFSSGMNTPTRESLKKLMLSYQALTTQTTSLEEDLARQTATVKEQFEILRLQEDYIVAGEKANDALQKRIADYEKSLESQAQLIQQQEADFKKRLKNISTPLRTQLGQQLENIEILKQHVEKFQEALLEAHQKTESETKAKEQIQKTLNKLSNELEQAKGESEAHFTNAEALTHQLTRLSEENTKLKQELNSQKDVNAELEKALEFKGTFASPRPRAPSLQGTPTHLSLLGQMSKDAPEFTMTASLEEETLRAQVTKLEKDLENKDKFITELLSTSASTGNTINQLEKAEKASEAALAKEKDDRIQTLEKELNEQAAFLQEIVQERANQATILLEQQGELMNQALKAKHLQTLIELHNFHKQQNDENIARLEQHIRQLESQKNDQAQTLTNNTNATPLSDTTPNVEVASLQQKLKKLADASEQLNVQLQEYSAKNEIEETKAANNPFNTSPSADNRTEDATIPEAQSDDYSLLDDLFADAAQLAAEMEQKGTAAVVVPASTATAYSDFSSSPDNNNRVAPDSISAPSSPPLSPLAQQAAQASTKANEAVDWEIQKNMNAFSESSSQKGASKRATVQNNQPSSSPQATEAAPAFLLNSSTVTEKGLSENKDFQTIASDVVNKMASVFSQTDSKNLPDNGIINGEDEAKKWDKALTYLYDQKGEPKKPKSSPNSTHKTRSQDLADKIVSEWNPNPKSILYGGIGVQLMWNSETQDVEIISLLTNTALIKTDQLPNKDCAIGDKFVSATTLRSGKPETLTMAELKKKHSSPDGILKDIEAFFRGQVGTDLTDVVLQRGEQLVNIAKMTRRLQNTDIQGPHSFVGAFNRELQQQQEKSHSHTPPTPPLTASTPLTPAKTIIANKTMPVPPANRQIQCF